MNQYRERKYEKWTTAVRWNSFWNSDFLYSSLLSSFCSRFCSALLAFALLWHCAEQNARSAEQNRNRSLREQSWGRVPVCLLQHEWASLIVIAALASRRRRMHILLQEARSAAGSLAQLVVARALQARGLEFKSQNFHRVIAARKKCYSRCRFFCFMKKQRNETV